MQSHTQSNRPPQRPSKSIPASAFAEAFLGKLLLLARQCEDAPPVTEAEAVLSGPFAVEEVERPEGARHAVIRADEPIAEGGRAAAVHRRRDEALRLAAVLPAVAAPPLHHVCNEPKPRGCYTLHCGRRFVAHLPSGVGRLPADQRRRLTAHLDLVRYLAANPHALALVLESVGPEALPVLGRALARRVEAALP
jgi:hypothetical protein